jgi:hypothetical protein
MRTGELVAADGTRCGEVYNNRYAYRWQNAEEAPPWLLRRPNGFFALPAGGVTASFDPDSGGLQLESPQDDFALNVRHEAPPAPKLERSAFEPLSPAAAREFGGMRLRPDVVLMANDKQLAGRVAALFEQVCGRASQDAGARRAEKERIMARCLEISKAIREAKGQKQREEALDEWKRENDIPVATRIPAARALELNARKYDEAQEATLPLQIVVVPAGKHFTSLPMFEGQRTPELFKEHGAVRSAMMTLPVPQMIDGQVKRTKQRMLFVAADDLQEGGAETIQGLTRVLQERYLSGEQNVAIGKRLLAIAPAGGPLAQPSGMNGRLFLPTLAQEFFTGGDEGRAWVRDNHPEIYQLLEKLGGAAPAA